MNDVDYADVQGLVRFGYKYMTEATYFLLRVKDREAARAWLRSAPVTDAREKRPPPSTALQIAFTAPGLRAIGTEASTLSGFSAEFLAGMSEENRSRRLGDVGMNAPSGWLWGDAERVPHVLVMLFAEPGGLDAFARSVMNDAWRAGFELITSLDTSDLHGVEPFGFMDGISQPVLDWDFQKDARAGLIAYENIVALGEFLLGYRNEYGKYTDRPLLDPRSAEVDLPTAEDAPEKKDLARNGTYLVMRHLRQDVRGFHRYLRDQGVQRSLSPEMLGSALVGRASSGDPLLPLERQPIPGIAADPEQIRLNQFTYDEDPMGAMCPIGAHVRRSNPRTADYPGHPGFFARLQTMLGFKKRDFQEDLLSPARFHRVLRRGREYGPGLTAQEALAPAPPDDPERGLRFVCLNANISRQFEFLQSAWVMSGSFNGLSGEPDPLLGNREASLGCPLGGAFSMPVKDGAARRLTGLPAFVSVRGGAYFFLPGVRALRYLASSPFSGGKTVCA